jgi:hypothetical protein
VTLVHLASKFLNFEIKGSAAKEGEKKWPEGTPWWKRLGVSQAELEDISNQVLDLYSVNGGDGRTTSGTQVRRRPRNLSKASCWARVIGVAASACRHSHHPPGGVNSVTREQATPSPERGQNPGEKLERIELPMPKCNSAPLWQ